MEVFTFVVRDGAAVDLDTYLKAIAAHGVSHPTMNLLRLRLAQVSGTRRAVIEVANGNASLSLRPLVSQPSEITVDSAGVLDKRSSPARRGADLGWQHNLQMLTTADDGMLVDESGAVVSSFIAPFVMIRDGAAFLSAHPRTTPSIALDTVESILKKQGVEIRTLEKGFTRQELMQNETWVVSSLYGASLVTGWLEYGGIVPARSHINRMGVPTHREVNDLRLERMQPA
ncbi:hypothetical protein [Corynebacterium lubricantis]|uniref:hypothetical protein n=1 Tax=Corynebacterium lubricantis TaxID=541095 RepID=UPI00036A2F08|nr:hypothetical protein [Corynebacterium lubricantis]